MKKKSLLFPFLLLLTASFSWGQLSDDYLLWSASRKLTAEDFTIKPKKPEIASSFGQFSMSYEINGFDFCWVLISSRIGCGQ
jgi:hypothetical protein